MQGNYDQESNQNTPMENNFDNQENPTQNLSQILENINNSEETSEISQESECTYGFFRANTAPVKPINKAEEFKWNSQYSNLERCGTHFFKSKCFSQIILR